MGPLLETSETFQLFQAEDKLMKDEDHRISRNTQPENQAEAQF